MTEITQEIKIRATPERIFAALTEVEELKAWHSTHVSRQSGVGSVLQIEGRR